MPAACRDIAARRSAVARIGSVPDRIGSGSDRRRSKIGRDDERQRGHTAGVPASTDEDLLSHFLVFGSVRFRVHVKTAFRIVSYRITIPVRVTYNVEAE